MVPHAFLKLKAVGLRSRRPYVSWAVGEGEGYEFSWDTGVEPLRGAPCTWGQDVGSGGQRDPYSMPRARPSAPPSGTEKTKKPLKALGQAEGSEGQAEGSEGQADSAGGKGGPGRGFPLLGVGRGAESALYFLLPWPQHCWPGLTTIYPAGQGFGDTDKVGGKRGVFCMHSAGGEETIWLDCEPALIGPEPCPVQDPGQAAPSLGTCYFQES